MIEGLQPYLEYKESGQQWLGQVPAHWDLKPGHAAFVPRGVRNTGMKEKTVLSLSYGRIKVKPTDKQHGLVPDSYETYQIVDEGNIIIRGTDMQNDHTSLRIGLSRNRGVISSAYLCFETRKSVTPDYGYQILNTFDLTKAIYRFGSGLRQNLDEGEIRRLPIFIPPLDEQAAIVRFLDHANRKIDGFIRAKRKLIVLLGEQKQAIIHGAVTRGLNPNAPLKPSGIPWLGDIPKHWEITALRRHWRVTDCKHLTVPFVEDGIPLASVVEVQSFSLNLGRCKKTTPSWYRMLIDGDRKPKRNDLIYCRNASVGACALVETDIDLAMGQDVCLIRSARQNQRFLNYLLHSPFMDQQLELLLVGSTFKRINVADIKALTVLIPPRDEQDAICAHLDSELRVYDTAIARTGREITLMQEYRTRLTADVVTGKLDVRPAAAQLSDLAAESVAEPAELPDSEESGPEA
jgi:type I restriction enzyme S subunit